MDKNHLPMTEDSVRPGHEDTHSRVLAVWVSSVFLSNGGVDSTAGAYGGREREHN